MTIAQVQFLFLLRIFTSGKSVFFVKLFLNTCLSTIIRMQKKATGDQMQHRNVCMV